MYHVARNALLNHFKNEKRGLWLGQSNSLVIHQVIVLSFVYLSVAKTNHKSKYMTYRHLLLLMTITLVAGHSYAQVNQYKPKIETCDCRFKMDRNFIKSAPARLQPYFRRSE